MTAALSQAISHQLAGRWAEAEASYRSALRADPLDAEATYGLGTLAVDVGQADVGLVLFRRAIHLRPQEPRYWNKLIAVLTALGRHAEAAEAAKKAMLPRDVYSAAGTDVAPEELARLAECAQQGRDAEGAAIARELVMRRPDQGIGWKALGLFLHRQRHLQEAATAFGEATRLLASDAEAHCSLGNVLVELGRMDDAVVAYDRALAIAPRDVAALNNLGEVRRRQGLLSEAEACYRLALTTAPDNVAVLNNLGEVLYRQGLLSQAEACYRQAIGLAPALAEVQAGLGAVLQESQRPVEAAVACRAALVLAPAHAKAHGLMARLHRMDCRAEAAVAHYRHAAYCDPGSSHYFANGVLLLPDILPTAGAIEEWRARYRRGIAELDAAHGRLVEPGERLDSPTFFLAYHGRDNRLLVESAGAMFRRNAPELNFVSPFIDSAGVSPGRRIRVGFLSAFFHDHTIGQLYRGLIGSLDRDLFDTVLIHTARSRRDNVSSVIEAMVDRTIVLPNGIAAQQQAVAGEQLDVLMYPDIGMDPETYFLAFARLAPVQIVSWGHPDTTGLSSIDYFLSSTLIEPDGADDLYTERLIRLSRLPCFFLKPSGGGTFGRQDLCLPENRTLYGCPQSLFKFHPDFDQVLADIVAGDQSGVIVLIEDVRPARSAALKARWAASYPHLVARTLFLPRQPRDRFVALLSHFDVLLDPPHFGSGNSFYETMLSGTPTVTWPGDFMRGRIVQAAYRQMGVADAPIADRLEDYAAVALALGRDPARRAELRRLSLAATDRLFEDRLMVAEFQDFVSAALAAAASGQILPAGWRPGNAGEVAQTTKLV